MLFAGRYETLAEVGEGSAARVLRARDRELDRDVALKLLRLEGAIAHRDRFLDEARVLAAIRHPNVIELLDFGVAEGQHYLVLEYASGGSLHPLGGQLEPARAIGLACQVLEALRAGHRQGVVHRDVKPGNVLLSGDGEAKLSDFGLARFAGRSVHTATGILVGTPQFMAPELFEGVPASPASDRYAWGCLFHHLLTGKAPIDGDIGAIAAAATSGTWRPTLVRGPAASAIAAAMARDPAERPDAGELLGILAGPATERRSSRAAARPASAVPQATLVLDRNGPLAGRPRQPPARGLRWAAQGLGLFALVALVTLAWPDASIPELPPVAAPSTRAASDPDEVLATWTRRDVPAAAKAWTEELHRVLTTMVPDLEDDNYGTVMRRHALRQPYPDVEDALTAARGAAPFRRELEKDRERLEAVLENREVPFLIRWRLYQVLRHLEPLDAYLEAWGTSPVYLVGPLLDRMIGIEDVDQDPEDPMEGAPDPPETGPPQPGIYRLHRWPESWSVSKYVIVPDPDNGNGTERLAWMVADMNPAEHGVARGHIDLGSAPEDRYSSLTLELTVANLLPPNLLTIRWNDREIWYRTPAIRLRHGVWRLSAYPDHRVRVRLPPEMWKPGVNRLEVRTRPVPGLRHSVGPNLGRVGVILGPPGS